MWILSLLPDSVILWFTNILLLVGIAATVAGFFVQRIPLVYRYQIPFKVGGILLLALGIYLRGGYSVEMTWRERVAEVEAKLAIAEKQSQEANDRLEKKSREKTKIIQGRQVVVKQYIDREVTKYDTQCVIPQPFIKAHNDAAEVPKK